MPYMYLQFNPVSDVFADELESGKIIKSGNTYLRDGVKLAIGKEAAKEALKLLAV